MKIASAAIFIVLMLVSANGRASGLFGDDDHGEICAEDLGLSVEIEADGFEVQTGNCENMDPDMDYSELQIGLDREHIPQSEGLTR